MKDQNVLNVCSEHFLPAKVLREIAPHPLTPVWVRFEQYVALNLHTMLIVCHVAKGLGSLGSFLLNKGVNS